MQQKERAILTSLTNHDPWPLAFFLSKLPFYHSNIGPGLHSGDWSDARHGHGHRHRLGS